MASLNLSANGPSISRSYQAVIDAPTPSGPAASSPNYAHWAVFTVSTPLVNAFQQDAGGKESVLKVQSSGEGDLSELIDEFSDGRVQFAFAKVKDPNTSLPKYALIAWCGEGVPERTKGYFTSHQAAVSKVLQGYHVEITARSDRDLTPESIVQKISDASGSKYSGAPKSVAAAPPPKPATKPVFMPTQSGSSGAFNPLGRANPTVPKQPVDDDGWGADAPPVTRSQLEKVKPAYQPTQVNMRGLQQSTERMSYDSRVAKQDPNVVRGGYEPIGKVDIAAIRREAAANSTSDNRPAPVKGAYEPVGKVDIAAIRARAQPGPGQAPPHEATPEPESEPAPVSQRAAAFTQPERLSELPKPKVANKFGGGSSFTGTKAPLPGAPGGPAAPAPPVGASRTFADEGGKTPAQLWAEKKGKAAPVVSPSSTGGVPSAIASQSSGGGGWKSGYTGKSWAPVQIPKTTGQSATSADDEATREAEEEPSIPTSGRVGALREAIGGSAGEVPGAATGFDQPPTLDASTKPNAGATRGVPIPGLPSRPSGHDEAPQMPVPPPAVPRSPTPEADEEEPDSPIRVAMPVSHTQPDEVQDAHKELHAPPPPLPAAAIAHETEQYADEREEDDEPHSVAEPGRAAAAAVAETNFGHAAAAADPGQGLRALVLYDYEAAEDNEISMLEGEYVTHIDQVDDDWWSGQNAHGQVGLFPSNYVEVKEGDDDGAGGAAAAYEESAPSGSHEAAAAASHTATAIFDYEAGEDNELTFPEGAQITDVEFPDDDWWSGSYNGHQGLFPANYVQLDQ